MLFVPKNDTNFRSRYDCSLLCFELPTQKIESGPDSFLRSSIFLLISSSAWSQLIFWYLPLTSLTGVLSRIEFSCIPCSRTEAPFAQCAPRFNGESNTGSCRIQTPFSTTASIEHPTEQWVQTVRLTSMFVAPSAAAAAPAPPTPNVSRKRRRLGSVEEVAARDSAEGWLRGDRRMRASKQGRDICVFTRWRTSHVRAPRNIE